MSKENNIPLFNTSEKEEKIFRRLEDPNNEGFHMLSPKATELEKMKYQVCDGIVKFKSKKNIPDEEVIKRLQITSAKLQDIINHNYKELTFQELMNYFEKLAASEKTKLVVYHKIIMIK